MGGVLVYGVLGYMLVEGWSLLDAAYMTMLTLTTVGYGEVRPLDTSGKIITVGLLTAGVTIALVALSLLASSIAEGDFGERSRRRRMKKRIDDLRDHFIVCAYGRVGRAAARELLEEKAPLVIIETREEMEEEFVEDGLTYIIGDSTSEEILLEAGVDRAKGLVCALDSDADNVFVTLTSRALNPDIFIVARASEATSVDRLQRAGRGSRRLAVYDERPSDGAARHATAAVGLS